MLISRNLKPALLTLAIFAMPVISMAQVVGPVNNPLGQTVQMVPGSYDSYQKTPVYLETIQTLNKRSEQAAALYQESSAKFFQAYTELSAYAHARLITPAVNSITKSNSFMPIDAYATAVLGYTEMKRSVDLQIMSIEEFPNSLAKRITTDASGIGVESVATVTAGIDFKALAAGFRLKLEEIDNQVKNQQAQVETKNRGPQTIKLLDLSIVQVDYTGADIKALNDQIEDLRFLSDDQRKILTSYTMKLISQMDRFFKAYGTEEAWRWNVHGKAYDDEKLAMLKELADGFFQRSYFRMRYGINLGMIGMKFERRILGLEIFMKNLNKVTYHPVGEDTDYYGARTRELNTALATADSKGQDITEIFKGEVGFVKSTNTLIAAVMGQDQIAKAMTPVIALILNDLYEENLMLTGRRSDMVLRYKDRYYDTTKPNAKNPNGWSDREVTLMRELEIDFNEARAAKLLADKNIPRGVTRVQSFGPESLYGYLQKSLMLMGEKAADYAKAANLQRTVDTYRASLQQTSNEGGIDDLLGL